MALSNRSATSPNFILEISTCSPSKKHTSEHPLPDLRPDLKSCSNYGLEQTFKIFKNLQKHISTSGVDQGHSSILSVRNIYFTSVCTHTSKHHNRRVIWGSVLPAGTGNSVQYSYVNAIKVSGFRISSQLEPCFRSTSPGNVALRVLIHRETVLHAWLTTGYFSQGCPSNLPACIRSSSSGIQLREVAL